jgi:hypothetical protein
MDEEIGHHRREAMRWLEDRDHFHEYLEELLVELDAEYEERHAAD